MKRNSIGSVRRTLTSLLLVALLMSVGFAGVASDTVAVANAEELSTALSNAATSRNTTTIYYAAGTSQIEVSGALSVPSNVTIDLSSSGGTLLISSGGVLSVGGVISGGAIEVSGGTLLRAFGSSITSTITTSSGGIVRGARVLTLENLSATSAETIVAISYAGETIADMSSYITGAATGVIYGKMAGSNYSSYKTIETVVTSAGNIFRLGTKYTDTLSLSYSLTYGGLTGASLSTLNPSSYTASDAAIELTNPIKDGFTFAGWTCEALGVTVPQEKMVIPEGTTGELTFIAMWVEAPAGNGGKTIGGSGSNAAATTTDDAATQQQSAATQEQAATGTQSTRRTRTASSSTKVSFTSDQPAALPSVATVSGKTFPWGWVFGGLAGLGVLAYLAAKLVNRKRN
ncbi:MAG: hypothetical protein VB061_13250 [Christensenella sp.]|nr:hypothetical protein [Christensenella sp.]